MAGELQASYRPAVTCYFLIRNSVGQIWNGSAFETYDTANYATYTISALEQGTDSAYYVGTFPSTITAGVYSIVLKQQLTGSPAETDPTGATGDQQWNGTITLPLSNLVTSGQFSAMSPINIARGLAYNNYGLYMRSAADHITPFTSGTISGQIARDGGSFGPLQSGLISEVGLGWYNVNLTSGDLNAAIVKLVFTGVDAGGGQADVLPYFFLMQRVSGG